jgi:hypothetical protein
VTLSPSNKLPTLSSSINTTSLPIVIGWKKKLFIYSLPTYNRL